MNTSTDFLHARRKAAKHLASSGQTLIKQQEAKMHSTAALLHEADSELLKAHQLFQSRSTKSATYTRNSPALPHTLRGSPHPTTPGPPAHAPAHIKPGPERELVPFFPVDPPADQEYEIETQTTPHQAQPAPLPLADKRPVAEPRWAPRQPGIRPSAVRAAGKRLALIPAIPGAARRDTPPPAGHGSTEQPALRQHTAHATAAHHSGTPQHTEHATAAAPRNGLRSQGTAAVHLSQQPQDPAPHGHTAAAPRECAAPRVDVDADTDADVDKAQKHQLATILAAHDPEFAAALSGADPATASSEAIAAAIARRMGCDPPHAPHPASTPRAPQKPGSPPAALSPPAPTPPAATSDAGSAAAAPGTPSVTADAPRPADDPTAKSADSSTARAASSPQQAATAQHAPPDARGVVVGAAGLARAAGDATHSGPSDVAAPTAAAQPSRKGKGAKAKASARAKSAAAGAEAEAVGASPSGAARTVPPPGADVCDFLTAAAAAAASATPSPAAASNASAASPAPKHAVAAPTLPVEPADGQSHVAEASARGPVAAAAAPPAPSKASRKGKGAKARAAARAKAAVTRAEAATAGASPPASAPVAAPAAPATVLESEPVTAATAPPASATTAPPPATASAAAATPPSAAAPAASAAPEQPRRAPAVKVKRRSGPGTGTSAAAAAGVPKPPNGSQTGKSHAAADTGAGESRPPSQAAATSVTGGVHCGLTWLRKCRREWDCDTGQAVVMSPPAAFIAGVVLDCLVWLSAALLWYLADFLPRVATFVTAGVRQLSPSPTPDPPATTEPQHAQHSKHACSQHPGESARDAQARRVGSGLAPGDPAAAFLQPTLWNSFLYVLLHAMLIALAVLCVPAAARWARAAAGASGLRPAAPSLRREVPTVSDGTGWDSDHMRARGLDGYPQLDDAPLPAASPSNAVREDMYRYATPARTPEDTHLPDITTAGDMHGKTAAEENAPPQHVERVRVRRRRASAAAVSMPWLRPAPRRRKPGRLCAVPIVLPSPAAPAGGARAAPAHAAADPSGSPAAADADTFAQHEAGAGADTKQQREPLIYEETLVRSAVAAVWSGAQFVAAAVHAVPFAGKRPFMCLGAGMWAFSFFSTSMWPLAGGAIFAASLHGFWWGWTALPLAALLSVRMLSFTVAPAIAWGVVTVLRMLPLFLSVPLALVILFCAFAVGGVDTGDEDGTAPSGTYQPLRHAVPRGASSAVAEVLRAKDYYGVLGLDASESPDDAAIRRAKRRASLLTHPDKTSSAGAEAAFHLVTTAAETLLDATARASYDRGRRAAANAARDQRSTESTRRDGDRAAAPNPPSGPSMRFAVRMEDGSVEYVYARILSSERPGRFCPDCERRHAVHDDDVWAEHGLLSTKYCGFIDGQLLDLTAVVRVMHLEAVIGVTARSWKDLTRHAEAGEGEGGSGAQQRRRGRKKTRRH
eukprot:jgi/Ulvmu1/6510/UM003_0143.1